MDKMAQTALNSMKNLMENLEHILKFNKAVTTVVLFVLYPTVEEITEACQLVK